MMTIRTSTIAAPSLRRLPVLRLRAQGGFSLIVALMMLIVIILLGVSASQMAINEERGSRNDRDRQLAFQAAEAAIKDAEFEIYGSTVLCNLPGLTSRGKMRTASGTSTCFNQDYVIGYVPGCSGLPNAGLCLNDPTTPAYLDGTNVDFLKDAMGTGNNHTVAYGQYTSRTFAAQSTSASLASQPISAYPPRYIIEAIPKNTSVDSATNGGCAGLPCMFRVTAMGFGANPNSQVVLQVVVATQD